MKDVKQDASVEVRGKLDSLTLLKQAEWFGDSSVPEERK